MNSRIFINLKAFAALSLLIVITCLQSSCSKEDYIETPLSEHNIRYERFPYGGYDMIWLPTKKGKSDANYIRQFQKKLRTGQMKNSESLPLNESIFAVEGLLNFEKCDAQPTRIVGEDVFEATVEIESIDENGEVWIAESELVDLYNYIIPLTAVTADEKVSTLDLDVININSSSVQVQVSKTISEKESSLPPVVEWFNDSDLYDALGDDVIENSYSVNLCPNDWDFNNPEIPCHIGYPSQPWPSWVYINDELVTYYNLLYQIWINGNTAWQPTEKMWFTNIVNPIAAGTSVSYSTTDAGIDCSYGRRDQIYMGGNYNSDSPSAIMGGPGCDCDQASEPVFADQICGEYVMRSANLPDENVTGEQMNRYAQNCIDHIDNNLTYWTNQGLPNAGIASIKYFGYAFTTSSWPGISGPAQLRYHHCSYKIGTRN